MVRFSTTKIKRHFNGGYYLAIEVDEEQVPAVDEFIAKHLSGEIVVTLDKPTKRRTLSANAYLWKLCDEIAKEIETDKEAVYQSLIKRVGVFDYVLVKDQAADRFKENWSQKGVGWWAEDVFYDREGVREFIVFYGTSVYTKEQMSRVIDEAEEAAKDLGVPILSKKEKEDIRWQ